MDPTVAARMLSHPTRQRVVRLMLGRDDPCSPTMVAGELELPLGHVSYHVRTLRENGVVRIVRRRAVRGSVEHLYQLHEGAASVLAALLANLNI